MKKIKVKLDFGFNQDKLFGGWLDGKRTYIGLYDEKNCYGTLSGKKLHRLVRNIIKEFEGEK